MQFKEIEHKFVVSDQFDREAFAAAVRALGPHREVSLRVRDRYFVTADGRARGYIVRHRHDRELHELTIKSVEVDAEVRDEINLALRPHDQDARVDAFVAALGVEWSGTVWKDLVVWHFDDCEVVYYDATTDERRVCCVEFEATQTQDTDLALAVVARYETATGFAGRTRTGQSLLELLWPGVVPRRTLTP